MKINKKANYATWLVYTELFKNKQYNKKVGEKDLKLEAIDLLKKTINPISPFYKFARCFIHDCQWHYISEVINKKYLITKKIS